MDTLSTANSIMTKYFGGDGGDLFTPCFIRSLALRAGDEVDAIHINDQRFGGDGGYQSDALVFDDDEYITSLAVRSGARVDSLQLGTNKGRQIGGGGEGGNFQELKNIRVISIGGRCGSGLDQIQVTYVENYVPSSMVQEDAQFVIAYVPPGSELEEYEDVVHKRTDSYEKITESMLNQKYSASAEAEYYAKVAVSTEIQYTNTQTSTVRQELEQELRNGKARKLNISEGKVGVLLLNGNIMQDSNGKKWMYPTTSLNYAVISESSIQSVENHYDLTGSLSAQMPGLLPLRTRKDGYVYYGSKA